MVLTSVARSGNSPAPSPGAIAARLVAAKAMSGGIVGGCSPGGALRAASQEQTGDTKQVSEGFSIPFLIELVGMLIAIVGPLGRHLGG